MACDNRTKVYLGYEDEYVTDKHRPYINFMTKILQLYNYNFRFMFITFIIFQKMLEKLYIFNFNYEQISNDRKISKRFIHVYRM